MLKKILLLLYAVINIKIFSYDIGGEIYLRGLIDKNDRDSEVEGRVLFSQEWEDYSLDLEYKANEEEQKIDIATIKFYGKNHDLLVGRNRLGWGVGYNFNPTDIFNKTTLAAIYDYTFRKDGRDSIAWTKYFTPDDLTELVYAFSQDDRDEDYGIRYRRNFNEAILEGLYMHRGRRGEFVRYDEENLLGLNLKGNIADSGWGYWNEMVYSFEGDYTEFIAGTDRYFMEKFYFNLEYYRNGRGDSKKENYNTLLISEGQALGKNYLIPSLVYQRSEKIEFKPYMFINIDDGSFQIGFPVTYYYTQDLVIEVTPVCIYGKEGSEYDIYKEELGNLSLYATLSIYF